MGVVGDMHTNIIFSKSHEILYETVCVFNVVYYKSVKQQLPMWYFLKK